MNSLDIIMPLLAAFAVLRIVLREFYLLAALALLRAQLRSGTLVGLHLDLKNRQVKAKLASRPKKGKSRRVSRKRRAK